MSKASAIPNPPIWLEEFSDGHLCYGYTWTIVDERRLAQLVARLVLGHYRHVENILVATNTTAPISSEESIKATISQLERLLPVHRDGWLFQMISWIALHISSKRRIAASVPQPRPADKGFDGLMVTLSAMGDSLSSVVICEDKATRNGRNKVRSQVWPDFRRCELGQRDNELMSEVTAILKGNHPDRVDELIQNIHWKEQRHYRISITINKTYEGANGRARLFREYSSVVVGDPRRRRAETVTFEDTHCWLGSFSEKVIHELNKLMKRALPNV